MYDVIIVGAGAAGMFAAHELKEKKVLVIEEGLKPLERLEKIKKKEYKTNGISNTMSGVGGAGLFSDGKLLFSTKVGKTDLSQFMPQTNAQKLIDDVEKICTHYGMDGETYPTDVKKARKYYENALKSGINLLLMKQKHLGSDKLPHHMHKMMVSLEEDGVEFKTQERADKFIIKNNKVAGIISSKGQYQTKNLIVAPGRAGSEWWYTKALKLNLKVRFRAVEVGVRVEVPNEVMDELTDTIYDPVFFIYSDTYDDQVRTFCTNKAGFVAIEDYEDFVCVNGHAFKNKKSDNTNFALLSRVNLTEPITDTYKYGSSVGKLASTIGGGKPILQRYIDLKKGRRSTWNRLEKSYIKPTYKDVTPGDISMALPRRVLTNLVDAMEKLEKIIPGVASNTTLLYAPEIKFFSTQIESNKQLQTSIKGLYIAGDGAGVSGNIVGAAATGVLAARSIIKKL